MHGKTRLSEVEVDLAELERLAEFAFIALIAWGISSSLKDSLLASGYTLPMVAPWQWIAFFAILLIYYKLIKVVLKISH